MRVGVVVGGVDGASFRVHLARTDRPPNVSTPVPVTASRPPSRLLPPSRPRPPTPTATVTDYAGHSHRHRHRRPSRRRHPARHRHRTPTPTPTPTSTTTPTSTPAATPTSTPLAGGPELGGACLTMTSQPLGDYPRRLLLDLAFDQAVRQRDIAKITIAMTGAHDDQPVEATFVVSSSWQANSDSARTRPSAH